MTRSQTLWHKQQQSLRRATANPRPETMNHTHHPRANASLNPLPGGTTSFCSPFLPTSLGSSAAAELAPWIHSQAYESQHTDPRELLVASAPDLPSHLSVRDFMPLSECFPGFTVYPSPTKVFCDSMCIVLPKPPTPCPCG